MLEDARLIALNELRKDEKFEVSRCGVEVGLSKMSRGMLKYISTIMFIIGREVAAPMDLSALATEDHTTTTP